MPQSPEAYLDIETTGLNRVFDEITVIGIYICRHDGTELIQLVGDEISSTAVSNCLKGIETVHTYNGSRFDLPFIEYKFGLDVQDLCQHRDLMYDCWRHELRGGLKAVEQQLGIPRVLVEVNGLVAVRLWWQYRNNYDKKALSTLLEYNKEDVVNLKTLKAHLDSR
ncbi:ribonuclease H-like domain-containing protein [Chloroflexota bacterium]